MKKNKVKTPKNIDENSIMPLTLKIKNKKLMNDLKKYARAKNKNASLKYFIPG